MEVVLTLPVNLTSQEITWLIGKKHLRMKLKKIMILKYFDSTSCLA
jgi:hypothetical protein